MQKLKYFLTHGITMNDVSVVKVSHQSNTDDWEGKNEYFFVIRHSLSGVKVWPNQVIHLQNDQKWHMGGGQVQDKTLLMGSCKQNVSKIHSVFKDFRPVQGVPTSLE